MGQITNFPIPTKGVADSPAAATLDGTETIFVLKNGQFYLATFAKVASMLPASGGNIQAEAKTLSQLTSMKAAGSLESFKAYRITDRNVIVIALTNNSFVDRFIPSASSVNTAGLDTLLGTSMPEGYSHLIGTGDAYLKTNAAGQTVRSSATPLELTNGKAKIGSGNQAGGATPMLLIIGDGGGTLESKGEVRMYTSTFNDPTPGVAATMKSNGVIAHRGDLLLQDSSGNPFNGDLTCVNGKVQVKSVGSGGTQYTTVTKLFNLAATSAANAASPWLNIVGDPSNSGYFGDSNVDVFFQYFQPLNGIASSDSLNAATARSLSDGTAIPVAAAKSGFLNSNTAYGHIKMYPKGVVAGSVYEIEVYGASNDSNLNQSNIMQVSVIGSTTQTKTITTYNQTGTLSFLNIAVNGTDQNSIELIIGPASGSQYGVINAFKLNIKTPV